MSDCPWCAGPCGTTRLDPATPIYDRLVDEFWPVLRVPLDAVTLYNVRFKALRAGNRTALSWHTGSLMTFGWDR
jgi:hypothetical protein